jgi:hypothetical protein
VAFGVAVAVALAANLPAAEAASAPLPAGANAAPPPVTPAAAVVPPLPTMPPDNNAVHLGVASCAGNNCHGAVHRLRGSSVPQDEYLIWSQKDKHRLAYSALLGARGLLIAHNLGLPDAAHQQICLACHTDDVAPNRRGRQFSLADGVGCEACHGGAEPWLGIHLSGAGYKANVAAGMYPTVQPLARAEKCLSCHFGDADKLVTHRIMGAGHPPMMFELDTYTAIEPAHFVVDKSYEARKGRVDDVQIWAIGQAFDLVGRMNALLDPKNAPHGLDPELVLFDCESCHHSVNELQWQKSAADGLGPGRLRLYDADAVMLGIAAERVAPAEAQTLHRNMMALHHATTKSWDAVKQEATQVRTAATALIPALAGHEFGRDDIKALAQGLIAAGSTGDASEYSGAQQATMALESLVASMKLNGYASPAQLTAMNAGLGGLYHATANDETYRPDDFAKALVAFGKTIPQ